MSNDIPPLPARGLPSFDPMAGPDPTYSLTPDALMAYCEARLNGIDSQVQTIFDQQQKDNEVQQEIGQLTQTLQQYGDGTKTSGDTAQVEQQVQQTIDTIKKLDPNSPALPALEKLLGDMQSGETQTVSFALPSAGKPFGLDTETTLSSDDMKGYIGTLSDVNGQLNSGSELTMIKLQSLMSQRQTAIELTTNIVQSLGDQAEKIAGNIGH